MIRILVIPVAGTLAAIAVSFAMANTTDPVLNDPGEALPRRTPRDSDNTRRDVTPGDAEAAERVGDAYVQRLKEDETGAKRIQQVDGSTQDWITITRTDNLGRVYEMVYPWNIETDVSQ